MIWNPLLTWKFNLNLFAILIIEGISSLFEVKRVFLLKPINLVYPWAL